MTRKVEVTLSEGMWEALEKQRGFESRASFVRRALERELRAIPLSQRLASADQRMGQSKGSLRDTWAR